MGAVAEIPAQTARGRGAHAQLPRVIHQTWKHAELRWPLSACAASFRKWNPGWEYQLWKDADCEALIRRELPEFLVTYLAYPRGIFRADIFRLVVLYLRGGVYADLDVECQRPLDELLAVLPTGDWEVLLARDHPSHERLHWQGRAMWMNAFMIAKPRSRFFRRALDRLTLNLGKGLRFDDVVQQTGPGLLSTLVESSGLGLAALGIRALPWRWIHPLPNVFVHIPERSQYKRLIRERTWRNGTQVELGDDEEGDPARGGAPYVAHYWWHSYIESSREVNMLLKYADQLLQSDGEIAEHRLQKWIPILGENLNATGQALALFAEAGKDARGFVIGNPAIPTQAPTAQRRAVRFKELAKEVLGGLPAAFGTAPGSPHRRGIEVAEGENAAVTVGITLLAVASDQWNVTRRNRAQKLIACGRMAERSMILIPGSEKERNPDLERFLQAQGYTLICAQGGQLWSRARGNPQIPRVLHLFESPQGLSRVENDVVMESWIQPYAARSWVVRHWTVESLQAFLAAHYPDFVDVFSGYPDDATRWGAARFFVLREEGGVAIKPGIKCVQPLDESLLETSAWVTGGSSTGNPDELVCDHAVASVAGHALWDQIDTALVRHAKGSYSTAVGAQFLTVHAREALRFLPRTAWPIILPPESFDIPKWPSSGSSKLNRRALRGIIGLPWTKLPDEARHIILSATPARGSGALLPQVVQSMRQSGWDQYYPVLTDEQIATFEAEASDAERTELEHMLDVEDIIQPRVSEQVVSTSLFWKNPDVGDEELPTPTLELLQNAAKLGLKKRFDPWTHYVQPLIRGAQKLAEERPSAAVRVYLARDLDFLIPLLKPYCEVRLMRHSSLRHNPGALWRFLAIEDVFDGLTVMDADQMEVLAVEFLDRTANLPQRKVGSWRQLHRDGTRWELCGDRRYFQYRPIIACGFGTRVRLPAKLLLQSFIWHHRRGAFRRSVILPDGRQAEHFQHPWPGYSGDEWFLATTAYPRLLPQGFLTHDEFPLKSPVSIADAALNAMTNPASARVQI